MTTPMPETMSPREKVAFKQPCDHCQRMTVVDPTPILAALASSGDHAELALMANAALEIYSDDVLVVGGTRRIHADNIILYVKNGVDALIAEVAALNDYGKSAAKEALGYRDRAIEAERKLAEADKCARSIVAMEIPPGDDPEQRLKLLSMLARAQVLARTFLSKEAERG